MKYKNGTLYYNECIKKSFFVDIQYITYPKDLNRKCISCSSLDIILPYLSCNLHEDFHKVPWLKDTMVNAIKNALMYYNRIKKS